MKASSIRRFSSCPAVLRPLIDLLPHPSLDFGEFRRGVEHEPVSIGVILFGRAVFQEMLADDAVDPGAGEGDDGISVAVPLWATLSMWRV